MFMRLIRGTWRRSGFDECTVPDLESSTGGQYSDEETNHLDADGSRFCSFPQTH